MRNTHEMTVFFFFLYITSVNVIFGLLDSNVATRRLYASILAIPSKIHMSWNMPANTPSTNQIDTYAALAQLFELTDQDDLCLNRSSKVFCFYVNIFLNKTM